jgi:hypothetical protein
MGLDNLKRWPWGFTDWWKQCGQRRLGKPTLIELTFTVCHKADYRTELSSKFIEMVLVYVVV